MRHPTTTRYQEDADADGWAETRVSAMRVELQAWRSQEQRLHVALRSEAALCQALREHVDLEEAARCRAQEEAVSERRSEEVVAQRSQQVRSAVARARQGTEKLAELMGVLRQAQSLAPSLQEEVEKLELEERQAQVSKWWAEKRWQDAARDLKLLEDQRQEVWLEEKETQLRMEEFSEQLSPLLKLTQLTPVDLEPMKVVVAASWEDDLQDSGEAVSSLKQRTSGRPPRSPRGEQKRPRARRVLVDTLADLDEFPTAVISSTSASSLPDKGSEKCVLVNTSPGLIDLGSRHRESVVVLDIEEAMEVCRPGSDKFEQLQLVKIHQRQRARGRSEDPMRRTRRASAAPHSTKGAECSFRRENSRCCGAEPARAAERSDGSQPAARSEGNLSQASRADRRELSEQSCLLCQREPVPGCSSQTTPGQPCAACNCGLRVFQHNTFLTVAEEEDEEFQDLPIRRTKSM